MRKFLLSIVIACAAFSAQAQVYVGGELGFWRDYDANETSLKILPEVGYNLDEKWSVGTVIGYGYNYDNGFKTNAFVIAPYARYTFAKLGPVNLFLDGGFGFSTFKVKADGGKSSDAQNAWEVGVKPGISVNLTEKLSFVSHIGFLGWRDADEVEFGGETYSGGFGSNGLGFDLSGNAITFGLYYNF